MKQSWVDFCQHCLEYPDFFITQGNRKIIQGMNYSFTSFLPDLTLGDLGYSKQKLTLLKNLYCHEEATLAAADMWSYLVERKKYSSACFHTYNHYVKEGNRSPNEKKSTRSPCLQSVVLTLMQDGKDSYTHIDVFYRTTELFKKFPADLLFLQWILNEYFNFDEAPIRRVTFHFANMTVHPMYVVVPLPHFDKPIKVLKAIHSNGGSFSDQTFKWLNRYLSNEDSVNKFRQARAVKNKFLTSFSQNKLDKIHDYTRKVLDDIS